MKAVAVIGSNYGDEGKGLMVDYHSRQTKNLVMVIRFNGGAQAGHTVVTPNNRHVFHHFGSGSLAAADTFLSKFFVLNPFVFAMERKKLKTTHLVYADPRCLVTTHYDIAANHLLEMRRTQRHGSCGIGFGETIERGLKVLNRNDQSLSYKDFLTKDLDAILKRIQDYFYHRVGDIPHNEQEANIYRTVTSRRMELEFKDAFSLMSRIVHMRIPRMKRYLVFEGAQGLLLDQNNMDDFPHLTRSNTGVENVLNLIEEDFPVEELTVNYVSRCYLTRHGEGPLPRERVLTLQNIADETNVFGEFQKHFRYAPLDLDSMFSRTELDFAKAVNTRYSTKLVRTMTCLDQILESVPVYVQGKLVQASAQEMQKLCKGKLHYVSDGPSFNHVKYIGNSNGSL